jgi:hypothetical protein
VSGVQGKRVLLPTELGADMRLQATMNYIKIFRGPDDVVERDANAFLAQVAEQQHRVMSTHARVREQETWMTIVVNNEPHPHNRGQHLRSS